MPVVPRANSTPTVGIDIAKQPRATNQDVSSGLRAIGGAANAVAATGLHVKERMDTTAAEDAIVQFEREKNDLFFNPETGYFNSQGKHAVDGANRTNKALTDLAQRHSKGLKSAQAQKMFHRAAQARITRDQQSIMQHASKGQLAYEAATLQATADNSLENGVLYWNDPERRALAYELGVQSVYDKAQLQGLDDPAILAESLQTFRSSFAKAVITAAVTKGDIDAANKMLIQYDKQLEGPDKLAVEGLITKETDKQYIMGKVDEIFATGDTLGEMLEVAREETDPDKRKEIERQVSNRYKANELARNERVSELYNTSALAIERGDVLYQDLDPTDLEQLDAKQRGVLRTLENNRISGKDVTTDWTVYTGLTMLPANKLKQINPADYYNKLAPAERQKLITLVNSAKKGKVDVYARGKATALSATASQLFGTGKKADPKKVNNFMLLVTEEAEARGIDNMKDFEVLLQQLAAKHTIEDGGFAYFDKDVTLNDVPTEYQSDLAAELRRAGKPVNAANMYNLYKLAEKEGLL